MQYLDKLFNFKNKKVLITGAGGHLCSEMALAFARLGSNLFLIDKNAEKLEILEDKIKSLIPKSIIYKFNVDTTNYEIITEINDKINHIGKVDILINGSGINSSKDFLDIDLANWDDVIKSQLNSVFISCKLFGGSMVQNKNGSIINISSTSADPPLSRAYAYSASKAAITNLTKNLAREWAMCGVRVNSLRPGFFPTEWNKKNFLDKKRIDSILNHTPFRRFGDPKELISAVLYLSSDSSAFVTGSEVIVDGGFSCMTI